MPAPPDPPPASPASPPPDGPAERFRRDRVARRGRTGTWALRGIAIGVVVIAIVVILTAQPTVPSANPSSAPPPITVTFGTPLVRSVNCTGGGMVYAERIPWVATSQAIYSGDLAPRVVELFDGDFVNDIGTVPNVTASNLCAGPAPGGNSRWYAVLADPGGAYVLTYTVEGGWAGVGGGPSNLAIENGSSLTIVMYQNLSNSGYGLKILGYANGAPIAGSVTL